MLRGLDVPTGGTAEEPTIVKVAGRARLEAALTVYVDNSATGDAADRQLDIIQTIDRLESAGVLTETAIVAWQDCDVKSVFEELETATGESLAPHFVSMAEGDAVDVPEVSIAIRRDGELTGLYPRRKDGSDQSVEDCIRALCNGDRVENLA